MKFVRTSLTITPEKLRTHHAEAAKVSRERDAHVNASGFVLRGRSVDFLSGLERDPCPEPGRRSAGGGEGEEKTAENSGS
jgi:hypothetical protein